MLLCNPYKDISSTTALLTARPNELITLGNLRLLCLHWNVVLVIFAGVILQTASF
jgi:hypothetical protein